MTSPGFEATITNYLKQIRNSSVVAIVLLLIGCDYSIQSPRDIKINDIPDKETFEELYGNETFVTYMNRGTIRESPKADSLADELSKTYARDFSHFDSFLEGSLHDSDRRKVLIILNRIALSSDDEDTLEAIRQIMIREAKKIEPDAFSKFSTRRSEREIAKRLRALRSESFSVKEQKFRDD